MTPSASHRIAARIYKAFGEGLRHVLEIAEVHIIALALFRQERMQRMVKVVVPLGIQPVAAEFRPADHASVIERAFSYYINAAIQDSALFMNRLSQFFQKVQRGIIENGVN